MLATKPSSRLSEKPCLEGIDKVPDVLPPLIYMYVNVYTFTLTNVQWASSILSGTHGDLPLNVRCHDTQPAPCLANCDGLPTSELFCYRAEQLFYLGLCACRKEGGPSHLFLTDEKKHILLQEHNRHLECPGAFAASLRQ